MDTVLHLIFSALIESLLFRLGRLVLRGITFGRLRLDNPTPFQIFLVAPLGFGILLAAILILASLGSH